MKIIASFYTRFFRRGKASLEASVRTIEGEFLYPGVANARWFAGGQPPQLGEYWEVAPEGVWWGDCMVLRPVRRITQSLDLAYPGPGPVVGVHTTALNGCHGGLEIKYPTYEGRLRGRVDPPHWELLYLVNYDHRVGNNVIVWPDWAGGLKRWLNATSWVEGVEDFLLNLWKEQERLLDGPELTFMRERRYWSGRGR